MSEPRPQLQLARLLRRETWRQARNSYRRRQAHDSYRQPHVRERDYRRGHDHAQAFGHSHLRSSERVRVRGHHGVLRRQQCRRSRARVRPRCLRRALGDFSKRLHATWRYPSLIYDVVNTLELLQGQGERRKSRKSVNSRGWPIARPTQSGSMKRKGCYRRRTGRKRTTGAITRATSTACVSSETVARWT